MAKQAPYISKSKYVDGLQCPKLLWYEYNRKDDIPPRSPDDQERMQQGIIVGELARGLYPDGIIIERAKDPKETHKRSQEQLKKRKPLFEAGFTYKNGYALPDILVPTEKNAWDLIEVKSTKGLKDEHLPDVTFQRYVYEGSGLKIGKCYLMHLNGGYVKKGDIKLGKLFIKDDITEKVDDLLPGIEKQVETMAKVIIGEEPDIKVGKQCKDCPMHDVCWSFLPEDHVFSLRGRNDVAFDLMKRGILKMKDIPQDYELNEIQEIQVQSHKLNRPHIDKESIREFIDELEYPLYFLDFETIALAIPFYDLSRPYEDIPFQYSMHIVEKEGVEPKHHSFLASGDVDPRPEMLKQLKELLGSSGSIIAYYASYEKRCLKSAVRAYSEYKKWFKGIEKRIVDLLIPFQGLFYYHPAQEGSASMKAVLPALTDLSYERLEIGDGAMASFEYMRVTFDGKADEKERKKVHRALEKYCGLDTMGMVKILEVLRKECE